MLCPDKPNKNDLDALIWQCKQQLKPKTSIVDYSVYSEDLVKAAEKGDSAGQYSLGDCYYNGEGVEQNYFSAVEWYTRAGNQWIAPAYRQLGICYFLEQGVTRDLDKAKELLSIAAEKGDSLAQRLLNKIQK